MRTTGLFDLQVNGYAGVDFNSTLLTPDALDHALHAMLRAGVTHCLPTLITAPRSQLAERLAALDRAVRDSRLGPLMVKTGIRPGRAVPQSSPEDAPGATPRRPWCHPICALVERSPRREWHPDPPAHPRPASVPIACPSSTGLANEAS